MILDEEDQAEFDRLMALKPKPGDEFIEARRSQIDQLALTQNDAATRRAGIAADHEWLTDDD